MKLKRILALALALVLVMSLFPAQALATEPTEDPTVPATTEAQVTETTAPTEASLPQTTEEPQPSEGGSLLGDLLNTLTGGDEKQPGETTGETTAETTSAPETSEPTAPAETTVPVETTVPTETTGETQPTEQTKSYFQNLMEQPTWRALFDAIMADPEAAMALNEKEVLALEDFLKLLPDPGENADEQEAKEEVESTIQLLKEELGSKAEEQCTCGTETEEHVYPCPLFEAPESTDFAGTVNIWLGTQQLKDGYYYTFDGTTIHESATAPADNYLYVDGYTLTLQNFQFSNDKPVYRKMEENDTAYWDISIISGIFAQDDITVIVPEGTYSRLHAYGRPVPAPGRTANVTGIMVGWGSGITIQGEGKLDTIAESIPANAANYTYGIRTSGKMTIKDVELYASGHGGHDNRGLCTTNGAEFSGTATITAIAGDQNMGGGLERESFGIYAADYNGGLTNGSLIVKDTVKLITQGGNLTGSGASKNTSAGIATHVLVVEGTPDITGIAGNVIGTNNDTRGILCYVGITLKGDMRAAIGNTEADAKVSEVTSLDKDFFAGKDYGNIRGRFPIWVENIRVDYANKDDVLGDGSKRVYYVPQENTLYLDGYTTKTGNVHKFPVSDKVEGWLGFPVAGDEGSTGVIAAGCDLNIHVKNDSTIKANTVEAKVFNCGILSGYDLKITADAGKKLTINAAASTGNPVGIYASGNNKNSNDYDGLVLHNLNLDITAGTGVMTRGIECAQNIYITGSANVTSKGGASPTNNSFGIMAWASPETRNHIQDLTNNIYIQDSATVYASTGNASTSPAGIRAESNLYISTSGSVTAVSGNSSYESAYGLIAVGDINISNGTVSATAGEGSSVGESAGIRSIKGHTSITGSASVDAAGGHCPNVSFGIYAGTSNSQNPPAAVLANITINTTGTVTAKGGNTGGKSTPAPGTHSRGIFASNEVTISSGTVKAYGGDTTKATGNGTESTPGSHGIEAYSVIIQGANTNVESYGGPAIGTSCGIRAAKPSSALGNEAATLSILDGANVKAYGDDPCKWSVGLLAQSTTDIVIKDAGTVYAEGGDGTDSDAGISCEQNITVENSNVTAKGGDTLSKTYGIYASKKVTISDAEVEATGGKSTSANAEGKSVGIYAGDNIQISTSGTVTAAAGDVSNGTPVGIWSETGNVEISAGTVTATGGLAPVGSSVGIRASQKDILISGTANVTAEGKQSNLNNASSCGMQAARGKVAVSGNASLTANSGTAHSSYAILAATEVNINTTGSVSATAAAANIGDSVAIYSLGDVNIAKGTVTANSGEAAGKTYGIYAGDEVIVSGGTVTTIGGDSKFYGEVNQFTVQRDHTSSGIVALNAIKISDGEVTATGNDANVGPSWGMTAPDIDITGGVVNVTSGNTENHYSSAICARDEGYNGIPTVGTLNIANATVTATSGEAKNQSQAIYSFTTVTIDESVVNATANKANSHSVAVYGNGIVTVSNSKVTAIAGHSQNGTSAGIWSGVKNVFNTSYITALSDIQVDNHVGINGPKLDSDSSVIFTDSIAKSTDETWENSLLYLDSQRNDTSYYGELRDDNGGTVNVVLAHSLDSNDVLIVKAGETLTTNGEIINGGEIYVNYTGMMTDTTGGKDYYEIVNGITKSSDPSVLADLTYTSSDADGYQKFNPRTDYVEGYENAERHYAQDNVTVTVTCADPGELVFNVHVWQAGKDTDTGVTQSGTESNVKTFTMPPYNTSYKAQPVKLIGQLLENFDLTIIKAFAEGTTPYADDLFLFTVKGAEEENETYSISVSIQGEGQVTIHDVPYGRYTIQEDSWSWRYTPDHKSYTLERKDINVAEGNSFTFVNEMEKEQWLDYNDIERNIFK